MCSTTEPPVTVGTLEERVRHALAKAQMAELEAIAAQDDAAELRRDLDRLAEAVAHLAIRQAQHLGSSLTLRQRLAAWFRENVYSGAPS